MTQGMAPMYEYDVAVSYAGPDRDYAEKLAQMLKDANLAVFFDLFEEHTVLGKRLYPFLQDIYENKARYCVVLISRHYAERVWPRHEIQAAFNRAVRERGEYILPVRLDGATIEGLPSDLAYISAKGRSIDDIGRVLVQKIISDPRTAPAFVNFSSVFEHFEREIDDETSSISIITSGAWIQRKSRLFESLVHVAARSPRLRMRFLSPRPESMAIRAMQELRAPRELSAEIRRGIWAIRENLPRAELRLIDGIPVYSAFCLKHAVLYSPYLHTRGTFAAPTFIYRRGAESLLLYEMIADDLERLWTQAKPWVPVDEGGE